MEVPRSKKTPGSRGWRSEQHQVQSIAIAKQGGDKIRRDKIRRSPWPQVSRCRGVMLARSRTRTLGCPVIATYKLLVLNFDPLFVHWYTPALHR